MCLKLIDRVHFPYLGYNYSSLPIYYKLCKLMESIKSAVVTNYSGSGWIVTLIGNRDI